MSEPPTKAVIKRQDITVSKIQTPRSVPMTQASSFNMGDIVFALFKHKKKILLATVLGLAAAVAVYFRYPPMYESRAKLLVRYLVERSSVDPIDAATGGLTRTGGENVLGSEVEILGSWDLAVQAAEAVGVKRLLPNAAGTPTKEAAARTITSGLAIDLHKGSNIIFVSYMNRDPELAMLVLNELVNRYFNKHLEVHRSAGAFDFVTQQTDQVRARLNQTEDALRDLKMKAGIVSLAESTAALSNEAARTEEQLHSAEAELAEHEARGAQSGDSVPSANATAANSKSEGAEHKATGSAKSENPPVGAPAKQEAPPEVLEQYQDLVSQLTSLRQARRELLSKYTSQNQFVKGSQTEINDVENQRRKLEKKYPDLPTRVGPIGSAKAKIDALTARLRDVQERFQKLSQLGPQIADLERQRQMAETNYTYFEATLEKARVDEALDPSKIPNISVVQRASPPIIVTASRDKIAKGLAVGGLALGMAFALLKELILNRTVNRPIDIEKSVGASPLLSIPYKPKRLKTSASKRNGKVDMRLAKVASGKDVAPWDTNHFIRPFCDAIRDRIGLFFELHHLTHKPKLVGVTGFSKGAGASTLAAGLAAALSETGDGKVLLVDVNLGPEEVHSFFRGQPAYPLRTALQSSGAISSAADNLYLATVAPANAGPAQLGLKKFFDLMPNMKASDFDYIIFDMPPLGQTSPTLGMAGFMDRLLLVVEADQDNRDTIRRGYSALTATRDNVSVILNKSHSYVPKWVDGEL